MKQDDLNILRIEQVKIFSAEPRVTDMDVVRSMDGLYDRIIMTAVDKFGVEKPYEILETFNIGKYTKESLSACIGFDPDQVVCKLEKSHNESTELLSLLNRLFSDPLYDSDIVDPAYIEAPESSKRLSTKMYTEAVKLCNELIAEPYPNPYTIEVLNSSSFFIKRVFIMGNGFLAVYNDEKMLIYSE